MATDSDNCAMCGVQIDRYRFPRAVVCGANCRRKKAYLTRAMLRKPVERRCKMCGVPFFASYTTKTGTMGKTQRKYCSAGCAREALRESREIDLATVEALRVKTRTCEHCGNEFRVRRMVDGQKKYCSKQCRRRAQKIKTATCKRCGIEFKHAPKEKGRFCSVECVSAFESDRFAAMREKRRVAEVEKRRTFRHNSALRLMAFRSCKSAAEVARQFGETESITHGFLGKCRGYKRIQAAKAKKSKWRKVATSAGRLSVLFPKERLFCKHLEQLLSCARIPFAREVDVPGPTGRRVDFLIKNLFKMWVVEAKNSSHTSDIDCCIGQAITRAIAFRGVPVVAFPSDLKIDSTAIDACEALGVTVVNELNIIEKWNTYAQ